MGTSAPALMRGRESGGSVRAWSGSEPGHERARAPRV